GDCHTIARSADGHKVALVHRGSMAAEGASVRYAESVDSGKTFGAFQNIMPFPFVVGADSVAARGGLDAAYNGDELQIVFGAAKFTSGIYAEQQASIYHWSAANGLKKMIDAPAMQAAFASSFSGALNKPQTNTFPIDYPSVGTSDDGTVFVAFQAASSRLSAAGFNYFNVYLIRSTDGGLSWSSPVALETAPEHDFRYPSVSKFNPVSAARQVAIVYQSDGEPASSVMDAAPVSHAELRFRAVQQNELTLSTPQPPSGTPMGFALSQNYPNPFNPNTIVSYRLSAVSQVSLKVFDVLGREVATLVDAEQAVGSYRVSFNAAGLSSGVYFYRLRAGGSDGRSGNFVATKKMLLAK
ncbi:MAG: T9SS type A sorting domain-containing protein, partial [Rhizobacter sp.]|nr:T9SS type A sorting domain-containing protein [Chlorobiales bacterium]